MQRSEPATTDQKQPTEPTEPTLQSVSEDELESVVGGDDVDHTGIGRAAG